MAKAKAAEKLGIENLKLVFAFILVTVNMVIDLVKKFNYAKALSLAFHIGENLSIVDSAKAALAEFRDLDVAESNELAAFLGDEFDIADDNLEARIEEAVFLLPEGYALLKTNIAYYEKVRAFVANWRQPEPETIPRLEKALRKIDLPTLRKNLNAA